MNNPPKCSKCSNEVPQGAAFCPICGAALPAGERAVGAPQPALSEITCLRCGKKYPPPPPNFCESCGYPLGKELSVGQTANLPGSASPELPSSQAPALAWTPYQPEPPESGGEGDRPPRKDKHPNVAGDKRRILPGLLKLTGGILLVALIGLGAWYAWRRWIIDSGGEAAVEPCSPVKPEESYEEANRLDLEGDLPRDSYFGSGQEYTIAPNATFRIPDGKTLIIEPGARVKFGEGSKMVVEGTLLACGKSNRRILFTANTATGSPGYWAGVEIKDADPGTVIGHASFEYGGKDYHAPLWVEASDIHIEDLKFDSNLWYPLSLDPNSTPLLRPPMEMENGPQGWEIRSGEMTTAQSWNNTQPYIVRDLLVIAEGGSLSISAGATVKFLPDAAINIKGDFSALGEVSQPVRFTSYNDGGDEGSPEPKPSDWVGLRFYGREGESRLEHAEITYGGQGGYRERGCLWMENANLSLKKVSISACDGFAISTDIASDPAIDKLRLDEGDPLRRWELRGGNLEGTAQRNLLNWKTADGEALLPVVTGWLGVTEKASLTIEPGVTLLFAQGDTGLRVDGALQVNGERKQPILLTSAADADYSSEGGAAAGDWGGLHLKNSLAQNSSLRYLRILYGGRNNSPCLRLENSSLALQDVSISDCASYAVSSDAASQPTVENLDIQQNPQPNLWEIRESSLGEPKTWEWSSLPGSGKSEIIRLVTGVVTVGPQASLRLAPGLTLKFTQGKGIKAQGALMVEGTNKKPVLMTSWRDLLEGTPEEAPQPGDWGGVVLEGSPGASLSFLEIRYAGNAAAGVGGLNLVGSQVAIKDLSITNCGYYPVTSDLASQPVVESMSLLNNNPADEWAIWESQLGRGEQRAWVPIPGESSDKQVLRTVTGLLTVEEGALLSISRGTVVKFGQGAGLRARGSLALEGENSDPVILTSWRDGEFSAQGGAQPGDWAGLVVEGEQANSTLKQTQIRFAGGESSPRGAVSLTNASPTISQVTIQDSAWYPLSLDAISNPVLDQVVLSGNTPANAVEVRAETLEASGETRWYPWEDADGKPLPRVLNGVLSIGPQASLRLESGLVIKFAEGAGLDVNGSLISGEATLTSLHDDEHGGDTDGSLSGEKLWQGVVLRGRGLVQLDGTLIRYAQIGMRMEDAAPRLSNVSIRDSWEAALGIDMLSAPQINDLNLENNMVNGILVMAESLPEGDTRWGVLGDSGSPLVRVVPTPLTIASGSRLAIDAGVIVKFAQGAGLIVEGQLEAGTESGTPVYLTALTDDEHGGDTDNASRDPVRGEWQGLRLNPNNTPVRVTLDEVYILYAATGLEVLNPIDLQIGALTIAESQIYGIACQVPLQPPLEEMGIDFDNNGQDISGCVEMLLINP